MANAKCATYNEFVSDDLTQENQNNLYVAAKGHNRVAKVDASGSSQSKAPVAVRPQFPSSSA